MSKSNNNYDNTTGERAKAFREKVRSEGLVFRPVVMHRDDSLAVRLIAQALYDLRAIEFDYNIKDSDDQSKKASAIKTLKLAIKNLK